MSQERHKPIEWQDVASDPKKGSKFDPDKHYPDFNPALANPDRLTEDQAFYGHPELTASREIMGKAIEQLQGRPKEAYLLTMREGKSLAEAAIILGISKSAVQIYRRRAINFLTAYCRLAIKNQERI